LRCTEHRRLALLKKEVYATSRVRAPRSGARM
jgi:hypothetical protein